jgi:cell division protein FtsI (penicillin-binding protein 3)
MSAGAARQREFLGRLSMLSPLAVELPGSRRPMAPAPSAWKEVSTMTIGYGQGIAVTPLHVVTAISALANGGTLRQPTIVAQPAGEPRPGVRVISERNSDIMRRLMRLVVTDGSGKSAEVPGFFVGGKTGTAQKAGPHGRYMENKRIAAFVGAFPMNAPRYAVYVMVDEPNPNANSHGFATAGWVAAPAARDVITRVAPVLGLVPEIDRAAQIQQTIRGAVKKKKDKEVFKNAWTINLEPGNGLQRALPLAKPNKHFGNTTFFINFQPYFMVRLSDVGLRCTCRESSFR